MACSRLFLKILADFLFGPYLQSYVLICATTQSGQRCTSFSEIADP